MVAFRISTALRLIIILSLPLNLAWAETITIGISEYCPVICNVKQEKPTGIAIDVIEKAFPSPTYTLKYEDKPFMRSLLQAQQGTIIAIATTEEDPKLKLIYPQHFKIDSRACTYTLPNSNWRYNPDDLSSLEQVKIGMIRYYNSQVIDEKLKQLGDQVTYITPGTSSVELRMLQMILSGRIDTSFLPRLTAEYLIKKNGWQDRLRRSGCGNKIYSETVAFSYDHPRSQDYADQLDKTFLALMRSGQYDNLLKKYGIGQHTY